MSSQNIICWNCDGFFSHRNDFDLLLQTYNPFIFCFQETKLKYDQIPSIANYDVFHKNHNSNTVAKGGVMTLVNKNFSSSIIPLHTDLEAKIFIYTKRCFS